MESVHLNSDSVHLCAMIGPARHFHIVSRRPQHRLNFVFFRHVPLLIDIYAVQTAFWFDYCAGISYITVTIYFHFHQSDDILS